MWTCGPALPSWARVLALTGVPRPAGGWVWTFVCPVSNKLVPVLYFDPRQGRFVSPPMFGRDLEPTGPEANRPLWRKWMKAWQQKQKYDLSGPSRSTMTNGKIREIFDKTIDQTMRLYLYAENNIPKLALFDLGHASRSAISRRRRIPIAGSVYYREKSGALRMKAEFTKKFGLVSKLPNKSRSHQKRR